MIDPVFIVDLFRPIVEEVSKRLTPQLQAVNPLIKGVWYDHGHPLNIMQNLADKNVSDQWFDKRYPLIVLFEDLTENMGEKIGIVADVSLNLCIVQSSMAEYKPDQRYNLSYRPILQPIYDTFIQAVVDSGNFMFKGAKPLHSKINRIYYGSQRSQDKDQTKNSANAQWDVLDGIEITNLQLSIYEKCRC